MDNNKLTDAQLFKVAAALKKSLEEYQPLPEKPLRFPNAEGTEGSEETDIKTSLGDIEGLKRLLSTEINTSHS